MRPISYSEVSKALTCFAQWDFAYGDSLAGSSLKRKQIAAPLSQGRAWGAAMAALHQAATGGPLDAFDTPEGLAMQAMRGSLQDDAEGLAEAGIVDEQRHAELETHLTGLVEHYLATLEDPMSLVTPERHFMVGLPSRTGVRRSNKYKLEAYVDGVTDEFFPWLIEFKLRNQLMPVHILIRSRQIRWYAWAYWQVTGRKVRGVVVEERFNAVPKPARVVKSRRKGQGLLEGEDWMTVSHAKEQMTTPDSYLATCAKYMADPVPEVLEALQQRIWVQRVPVQFRPGELEEAGAELTGAASLISQLDSGAMFPLRNATRMTCQNCDFRDICDDPSSSPIDEYFDRHPAKRDRQKEAAAA